jgi:tryptophanyl-tRNA synthetase
MKTNMDKEVILTGLRANGEFHLGNYLGALLPIVEMQREHSGQYVINLFVPDLHSFTTPIENSTLHQQILDNLKAFVAAGLNIDDPNSNIYRQSHVPAHSELTVILNNFTYYGELQRMTQFKEKSEEAKDGVVTAGLFDYPVLMAADILLYGAKWIPVGEDQRQHIELARDVAVRMNNRFGELFVVPEPWDKQLEFSKRGQGVRIRSLRNPDKKMSKSVEDPAGTVMLTDDPDEAAKKVMGATTDSVGTINYEYRTQPGISNLLTMLALLQERPIDEAIDAWQGKTSYGDLKSAVAEAVRIFLSEFQAARNSVSDEAVMGKLEVCEAAMRDITGKKLYQVQQAVGLRPKA